MSTKNNSNIKVKIELYFQILSYWLLILSVVLSPIYMISHPRAFDNYFTIGVSSNYYPVMVIIILSFGVTAIGTFIYIFDVIKQAFNANNKVNFILFFYRFSLMLGIGSVILCFKGIYDINIAKNIHEIVSRAEVYSGAVFIILLIIDISMLVSKQLEIKYYKVNNLNNIYSLEYEKRFIFDQMILIDIPVLLGILFISYFISSAESTGYYCTQIGRIDKANNFDFFKTFFAVGSIGMHIIFSQFIFVVLNTKNIIYKIKEINKNDISD